MGMSPEALHGYLRKAVETQFDGLTKTWVPRDEVTSILRNNFTNIVMNVGGATTIDSLVSAVQEVGMIEDRDREVLYPEFLLATYNLHLAAQEHTIPSNKKTPEQILKDLKPGAAKELAKFTFKGHPKEKVLVQGCTNTTYRFVHGQLIINVNTGSRL